jgi:two-component system sensor histidine kinase KdpD
LILGLILKKEVSHYVIILFLLAAIAVMSHLAFTTLGITGITMMYLLAVVMAAYFFNFGIALASAILAFLAINYFFVAPRYTFQIAHVQSWVSLIGFLVISVVISSLVKQLKSQTQQSQLAEKRAKFARTLAENLALTEDLPAFFQQTSALLSTAFNHHVYIAHADSNYHFEIPAKHADKLPDANAITWVAENGKAIGPHTANWHTSPYWLIPFNRLPSKDPVLIVYDVPTDIDIELFTAIKACVDQISQAYQRLINSERARLAELKAQEESIQSALLASIAHDMRTPLTSILGAATTLQQTRLNLDEEHTDQLTALIAQQAQYLATTSENILSLMRLESSQGKEILMDLQSPEEIIGVVIALYKNRGSPITIKANIAAPDLLILANANLLTQALINLIDNANQANMANGSNTQNLIEVEVKTNNQLTHLSVKDNGIGFPKAFKASDIKKFSSGHASGFGLGLSIVQAIAKAHHAQLTIQNLESGGASVTMSFNQPEIDTRHV